MSKVVSISHATPEEVDKVISAIEDAVLEFHPAHIVMAMLALCFMIQKPDASHEEVLEGVKGASEWIALYLANAQDEKEGVDGNLITLN